MKEVPKIHCRRNKNKTFCGLTVNNMILHCSEEDGGDIDTNCFNCIKAMNKQFINKYKDFYGFILFIKENEIEIDITNINCARVIQSRFIKDEYKLIDFYSKMVKQS